MEKAARFIFQIAAITNWLVTVGGIIDPTKVASAAGLQPANYPFLVRIWAGMAFMFGWMFWEVSIDPRGRVRLIKYAWIEKFITASSVTLAYILGEIPTTFFILIVITDWIWIPPFLYFDLMLRRM